jgi:cytochrome oxidase assembly protein ShyY1
VVVVPGFWAGSDAGVFCGSVYRFLLSPRWLGLGALMVAAATVMVGLGLWQLDRYDYRSAVNARIDAAAVGQPVPLAPDQAAWTKVVVTGRYDPAHEILARARTVGGRVGFEVVTPLVLADGSAVLVDRGWLPPSDAGAATAPEVPAAPAGEVTVVGRVRPPESRGSAAEPVRGRLMVRRIAPAALAPALPYRVHGQYLSLESQTPPTDPRFVLIRPTHENATMNAGYVAQWWLFAALTLFGFGFLAVRERRARAAGGAPVVAAPAPGGAPPTA